MARHLATPDPDPYNDDADIDEASPADFEARGFGLVDPPTRPIPAASHAGRGRIEHVIEDPPTGG